MKTMYMHTLGGKPAFYLKDDQIYYAGHNHLVIPDKLATSLKQIRREQLLSIKWRLQSGYGKHTAELGYLRVTVK